jgi:peptide/nickel transport system permease protein
MASRPETLEAPVAFPERRQPRPAWIDITVRLVREKPLGLIGAVIVLAMFCMGVFADILAPYPFDEPHYNDSLQPSNLHYLLGTDFLGRDLLSRLIHGARVSLLVGLCAVALGTVLSGSIGITSGYFGGKFDTLVQRFIDAWMSFPPLLLLLFIMSIIGPGALNVILVLGLIAIRESRVLRGSVLSVKVSPFVDAARVAGASDLRILWVHILPNVMAPIIILSTSRLGAVILIQASLSFLGFGIPPPFPDWGRMLGLESRLYMQQAPWLALWPGVFLSLSVFGWNVFGDALRDLLDPRMRGAGRMTF